MLTAIGFCNKDAHLALDILSWIGELGGCPNHEALLVVDADTNWKSCKEALSLANKCFRTAKLIHTDHSVNGWPKGPNALFLCTAQHCQGQPFFWLEPDAIPLVAGWLDKLEAEYQKAGKAYLGRIYKFDNPKPPFMCFELMSGIGVYPPDAFEELRYNITDNADKAWDVECRLFIMPRAGHTPLIQNFLGLINMPPTFVPVKTPESPINALTLDFLNPEAVIFHRVKDGSLLHLLRNKQVFALTPKSKSNGNVQTCIHGGDVGDMIYGLCAMKAIGVPIRLVLHHHPVREPWTAFKVGRIAPLLIQQCYIDEVAFEETAPATRWDFNAFREYNWARRANRLESLCQSQHRIFKLPEDGIQQPWLEVDYGIEIPGRPVVIHRSPRYHNHFFPWAEVHRRYKDKAVFIGMPDEHQAFCKEVGPLPHHRTADYLELARVIAGATLFIGNQSAPYAIAEGLKQNAILEAMPGCNDCMFYRDNLANNLNGQFLLPDV